MDPERPERDDDLRFPDASPLRRIQATTAGLIALVAVVTLLSGNRPDEVRWGTGIGLATLAVVVALVLRRRKRRAPEDEPGGSGPGA